MSETKKPGTRDISDLKARLGMKKAPAPALPGAIPSPMAGKTGGAFVPAPHGAAPARPQMPDPRLDPFAAMNAMAQPAAPTMAPMMAMDDGKPAASVQGKGKARFVKLAALIVPPLLAGYLVGGVMRANSTYNATIDDAAALTVEFKKLGKDLQSLYDGILLIARERGADKKSFKLNDQELTQALSDLKLEKPGTAILVKSNLYMDPNLVEDMFVFYRDLATLYERINTHVRLARADEKLLGSQNEALKKFDHTQFGAIIRTGGRDNAPPAVELVELGNPVCPADPKKPNPNGCGGAPPIGFEVRADPSQSVWNLKAWSPAPQVVVDSVLFLAPNTVFTILMRGSDRYYAEVGYLARLEEIETMTKSLVEARKNLETRLNAKAQESKHFAL